MNYTKIIIKDNPNADKDGKRAIAEITKENGKTKIVKFGLHNSGGTYFDGATPGKKEHYIERHDNREKWGKDGVCTAGFYSRWVLWDSRSKSGIKEAIKKHSGVNNVTIGTLKKIRVTKPN